MPEPSVGLLSLFRSRLFLIPAAVYLVVGLALAFLPFTNYLGLEFSLGVCIVAGFMGGPLAVSVFRRRIPGETMKARFAAASDIGGIALWLDASLLHGAAVLFSLIGLAASAFVSKPCAPLRGAGFFVLLPFVTVVYSSAWGLVFASLVRRPRRAKILVTVFALLTLAFTAIHFVTGTAVWVYNPFFGHFPGPIYDAAATPTTALLAYRVENLATAWLVVYLLAALWAWALRQPGQRLRPRITSVFATFFLLITVVGLHHARFALGFDQDQAHLREHLDGHVSTEHFDIYYPRRDNIERQIKLIAADHEFFFAQIERELGIRFPHRITSWIYPSEETKKKWMGAGGTEYANCHQHQMHVNFEQFPLEILHHEMIHVMLGDYGLPILGYSAKISLTEGVAKAFGGPRYLDEDIDRLAAGMKAIDRLPRIKNILGLRFWAESGSRAYTAAGSFVRYLSRLPDGAPKLLAAYRWGNIERQFGRPLDQLEKDWLAQLATVGATLSEAEIARAQHLFGTKSIFEMRCPREVARLTDEADRQASRDYFFRADLLFRQAAELDKDDVRLARHRLMPLLRTGQTALAERLALDISAAQGATDRPARDRAGHVVGSQIVAQQADLIVAALAWSRGENDRARQIYEKILGAELTSSLVREAACAQYALYHPDVEPAIRAYLTDFADERASRWVLTAALQAHADDPVLWYLMSRRMLSDYAYAQAIQALQRALALGLPHPELVRTSWGAVGYASFMTGDLAGARAAYRQLRELQGASDAAATTDEWLARIDAWPSMPAKIKP